MLNAITPLKYLNYIMWCTSNKYYEII